MRLLLRSALLTIVSAGLMAAPAQAVKQGYETVVHGKVKATLSWKKGPGILAEAPHLRITRAGKVLLSRDLRRECQLCVSLASPHRSLHISDLDGNGEPEVRVDLFTGGAHCCSATLIYSLKAGGASYARTVASWGDDFYSLKDLNGDGRIELVTQDDRFAYEFAAYVFSWQPPLIYDLTGGRLVDVTRSFPSVTRDNLAALDKQFPANRKSGEDVRGLVAARVADLYLLGRGSEVDGYLAAELKNGDLNGDKAWPAGKKFKPALLKFLKKTGYI
ncbi:MAG: hypothetical protein JWM71_2297 [Solirubrobacteraceae bacterium]|nr:hypothetical protein [Solirubrobacteraceae bacterium]